MLAVEIETDIIHVGLSGAPVFVADEFIGLVIQGQLERCAHIVPVPVIQALLDDCNGRHINGVPELGVFWQNIDNEEMPEYLKLDESQSGVLISRVVYGSSAYGVLEPGDVITAIDGVEVARNGMVLINQRKLHFSYLISRRKIGEIVDVAIIRGTTTCRLRIALKGIVALVPARPGLPRTFVVYAGLVMIPLTYEYIFSPDVRSPHFRYLYYYYDSLPTARRSEIVVLINVIPNRVNYAYRNMNGVVIEKVNGVEISCMSDVCRALERPVDGYQIVEIDNHGLRATEPYSDTSSYGRLIVMNEERASAAHREMLIEHGLEHDRSADLRTSERVR